MAIKYLIFDLDDTLLRRDKTISDYTVRILEKAHARGYVLVFDTSRSKQNSSDYAALVHPDYGIYNGGCQIVDRDGRDLYSIMIPAKKTKRVTEYLNRICSKISVQTHDAFLASDAGYKRQNAIHTDFSKGYDGEAYKILCFSMDHALIERIAEENGLEFQNYLNRGWHRLSVQGANKWNGIIRFLSIVGGNPGEVAYFGDDVGDLEAITGVGLGVAMANSQPTVLATAPNVALSNDEDGLARFIEEHLL